MLFQLRWLILCLGIASSHAAVWPEVSSDLRPDPAAKMGTLSNGVRTVVFHTKEPQGRISLRLLVRVGSLHETDEERGLAHFVEHMAFRGTQKHPGDGLTTELQRHGIAFGPESTAFTSFDHTIYHLELPTADEATLRYGLSVFYEYASALTFDAKLIERERGVVLNEKRNRDTPDARSGLANMHSLWPAARQVRRPVIGTETTIRNLTRAQFVSFYDRWYRPERLALIVVGDVDSEMAQRVLAEVFENLQPRAPAPLEEISDIPEAASSPTVDVFTDPGLVGAICVLQHPFREGRTLDDHAARVRRLHRSLAFTMFNQRVIRLAGTTESNFVSPFAGASGGLPGWSVASFGVGGNPGNWKDVGAELEREHRRAFQYGFNPSELAWAKSFYARSIEEAVKTSPSRTAPALAGEIVSSLLQGNVFATPATYQADLVSDLAAATAAECAAAFRDTWTTRPPHVFIAGNPLLTATRQQIADALNESRAVPVVALPEVKPVVFAYSDWGAAGMLTSDTEVSDLAIRQGVYANGVRFNFKATDFETNTVHIRLRVGEGRQRQPDATPGLDLLANHMFQRGGLGRHTYEELQELVAAHSARINFYVDNDALGFAAECPQSELLFTLQTITAYISDAALRPNAMREASAAINTMYASLNSSPGGPIWAMAAHVLAQDDDRFGIPFPPEMNQRTPEEVAAWLKPQLLHGAIELAIVGDTDWQAASNAVAQTLGTLPQRNERQPPRGLPKQKPLKKDHSYVFTTAPEVQQVAIARFCPINETLEVHGERRCRLLASLLTERLRLRLREELGATYNASAEFVDFEGFPSLSYFVVYAEVSPPDALRAAKLLKNELTSIRKKRFTDDEFNRVKAPFVKQREQDHRENGYWCHTVLRDAQQRPERLAAARDRLADAANITRAELEALAKRFLDPNRSLEFVAYPGRPTPTPPANFTSTK